MRTIEKIIDADKQTYQNEFDAIEKEAQCSIPYDIKEFLINHGVRIIYAEFIDSSVETTLDKIFGFSTDKNISWIDLIDWQMDLLINEYDYPKSFMPIFAAGSEWVGVDLADSNRIKFVWAPEEFDEFERNSCLIADSFQSFMTKIEDHSG